MVLEVTATYIYNKNTKKFHREDCYSVDQMKESNKGYYNGSRDELISQGFSACKNCNAWVNLFNSRSMT